jgi:hypothetical protein
MAVDLMIKPPLFQDALVVLLCSTLIRNREQLVAESRVLVTAPVLLRFLRDQRRVDRDRLLQDREHSSLAGSHQQPYRQLRDSTTARSRRHQSVVGRTPT